MKTQGKRKYMFSYVRLEISLEEHLELVRCIPIRAKPCWSNTAKREKLMKPISSYHGDVLIVNVTSVPGEELRWAWQQEFDINCTSLH
jgi:hypothetical protein